MKSKKKAEEAEALRQNQPDGRVPADEEFVELEQEAAGGAGADSCEDEPVTLEAEVETEPAEVEPMEVDVEALTAERDALLAERDGLKDQLLRGLAEFDNYRKRTARDHERMRKTATSSLMQDLLPVLDNLERAYEHASEGSGNLAEGVEIVLRQFREALGRHGLKPIPAVGEKFDPHVHEAIMHVESAEYPADYVAQEFQKGYWLGDHILRPPKVSVSKGAPEAGGPEAVEGEDE